MPCSRLVIVRAGGRSSIPEAPAIEWRSRGVLDTPHSRGMTSYMCGRFTGRSNRAGLLRVFPRLPRQRHRARGRLECPGVGRGAVADAAGNALGDTCKTDEIVGEVPVEIGHGHAGVVAIDLRRLCLARDV